MRQPPVEVHDLTVSYDTKPVLWDIDFEVPVGTLTAVIGPNGAGKSTLLKAMMGLIPTSSGYTLFSGKPIDKMRKEVAYVPQRESVDWNFPVSVMDVVLMGRYAHLGLFRRPASADKELAMEALRQVGMQDLEKRQISELSGGQQQRVFLARALVQKADIYLMDEPLAGVDAATESVVFELLQELRSRDKTVLVVHHDLQSIEAHFDRVLMLNLRLVAHGPIGEVFNEQNLQTAYSGRMNILSRMVEKSRAEGLLRE